MSTVIDGVPHLSAETAAARLGTTPMKVLILLKERRLAGVSLEGAWYVTEASLEGYRPEDPAAAAERCRTVCSGSCGCH